MQQLGPGQMAEAEYKITQWVADVPSATSMNDILRPDYWSMHAARLSPWDRIQIRADDMTWMVEAIVVDCARTWAKVSVLFLHDLTSAPDVMMTGEEVQTTLDGYEVRFRGPRRWSVIRLSDAQIMLEDAANRDIADTWLRDFASGAIPKAA